MTFARHKWLGLCALALAACGYDPGDGQSAALGDDAATDADAASGDASDAATDSGADTTVSDGSSDAAPESSAESGSDATGSLDAESDAPSVFCGDGIRGLAEECDDGVVNGADLCTSLCEIRDQLAVRAPTDASAPVQRILGTSRHPLAVGSAGFAVAWVEPQAPVGLGLAFYSPKGVPTGAVDRFGVGSVASTMSAPAVAALPNGKYAVVWSDLNGDGDGLGVVARIVDPTIASTVDPTRINQVTSSSQYDADVVWTGTELVVAWTDLSVFPADVKLRTYGPTLTPTSNEQTLASTSAGEGTVALATFNGSWAAAWREISGSQELVRVKVGNLAFSTPAANVGPYEYPPALVDLDATHLLLVYAEATGSSSSRIRAAILDVSAPGVVTPFDITPLAQGDAGALPTTFRPAAARVGSKVFVGWTAEAKLADPKLDELWLKETSWNGTTLDLSAIEVTLPRWDGHRLGDQRFPALAPSTLGPGGALAVGWVDQGSTLAGSATTDVAVSLFPVPMLRNVNADGGGL